MSMIGCQATVQLQRTTKHMIIGRNEPYYCTQAKESALGIISLILVAAVSELREVNLRLRLECADFRQRQPYCRSNLFSAISFNIPARNSRNVRPKQNTTTNLADRIPLDMDISDTDSASVVSDGSDSQSIGKAEPGNVESDLFVNSTISRDDTLGKDSKEKVMLESLADKFQSGCEFNLGSFS